MSHLHPAEKRILTLAFVVTFCLLLAACASGGFVNGGGAAGVATPAADTIGSGAQVVGLLATDEPGNLSDGSASSVYLAGKLAATTLSGAPVTLVIRRYDDNDSSLRTAGADLLKAGAKIIIGPNDDAGAAALATLVAGQDVPIISLGQRADISRNIYAAGPSAIDEAEAAADEMQRRGYRQIVMVRAKGASSYAAALSPTLAAAGFSVSKLEISNPASGLAALLALADAGTLPDAIVFTTGPELAAALIGGIRADARLTTLPVVGHSGWGLAPDLLTSQAPGWYTAPNSSRLPAFSQRFATSHPQRPSLRGAIAYDLVVLAGALPQLVPDSPYGPDVLTNQQGFSGQTGSFRFDGSGLVQRSYDIVTLK